MLILEVYNKWISKFSSSLLRRKCFSGGVTGESRGAVRTLAMILVRVGETLAKMHYFSISFQKLIKPCVNFSRVWTKNANCWEILRKF